MNWKWFLQVGDNENMLGPMSTEEVQSRLSAGELLPHNLIWSPGLDQWQNLQTWNQNLATLGTTEAATPVVELAQPAWHYASSGQSRGPMDREILISELKNLPSLAEIMVWTRGMKEWAPLFEFHDLLEEIGVNRRAFPRADLTGKAILKVNDLTIIAPLRSVSEGGFGIALSSGLVSGQEATCELQSSAFRETLYAKAEVRYVGEGAVGMKFTQINPETRSVIVQIIKQNQMRFNIKAA